jgi:hypothetical protein
MAADLDAKLYAAVLYAITELNDVMGDALSAPRRASLASRIVREIERRRIIGNQHSALMQCAEALGNIKREADRANKDDGDGGDHLLLFISQEAFEALALLEQAQGNSDSTLTDPDNRTALPHRKGE